MKILITPKVESKTDLQNVPLRSNSHAAEGVSLNQSLSRGVGVYVKGINYEVIFGHAGRSVRAVHEGHF